MPLKWTKCASDSKNMRSIESAVTMHLKNIEKIIEKKVLVLKLALDFLFVTLE